MTEFIGSRISLISKRDIRYVGTLHEISSENSTVALEQVISYGTEGRRPDDEVPPSLDNVYDYIVFRGSDVKDLRVEETPKENEPPKPPRVPDDPAILGSARKRTPSEAQSSGPQSSQTRPPQPQAGQGPQQQQNAPTQPGQHPHQPLHQHHAPQFPPQNYPYNFPPPNMHNQRFGPQGFPAGPGPGPHGFPPGPYGAPPNWYPPYGFPQMPPGQFPPHQIPIGPSGHQNHNQMPPQQNRGNHAPSGSVPPPEDNKQFSKPETKPAATVKLPSSTSTPIPLQEAPTGPPSSKATPQENIKAAPTGSKSHGRIMPAVPLASPNAKAATPANGDPKAASGVAGKANASTATKSTETSTKTVEEANRDARAAVAAAMAKLPNASGQAKDGGAMDNLTRKVSEMRTNDSNRGPRGGHAAGHRGGRGGGQRGGRDQTRKVEVPKTDYDFESANAKFNKQDLVKEAIASGSPIATPGLDSGANGDAAQAAASSNGAVARKDSESSVTIPLPTTKAYNKTASFFDNISSEMRDRTEIAESGQRLGGREFRNEERQKNFETFGQGSVDNGFRYRGRGRGRGRGGFNSRRGGGGGIRGGGAGRARGGGGISGDAAAAVYDGTDVRT